MDKGYLLATDIADYLVKKGDTFRNAHAVVGKLVKWANDTGKSFSEISLENYKHFSPLFDNDVYLITFEKSISARNNPGGTAPEQVKGALARAKELLSSPEEIPHKNRISD